MDAIQFSAIRTPPPAPAPTRGKFTSGSTMRHILVMTGSASIGLMSVFLVDFADLYFLSLLGEVEVAAAIGYAAAVVFFTIAIGIALGISATALVSPALGAGKQARARRRAVNALLFAGLVSVLLTVAMWLTIPQSLRLLGAENRAFDLADGYLRIVIASTPLLLLAMTSAALLRSVGDAKRAMYVTLSGAIINAVLDPLFIFGFGWGVEGAALATAVARIGMFVVGLYGLIRIHKLLARPRLGRLWADVVPILAIAAPALLTNFATPVANAYVTGAIAPFGVAAVAGWAVLARLIPVSFAAIFALSGAVGPVIGQNQGVGRMDRVRSAYVDALIFVAVYTLIIWALLAASHGLIARAFNATDEAAALIGFFCLWMAPAFGILGLIFVAMAAFNQLGRPHYATLSNWGRATLGTMVPVYIGAQYYGAYGVIAGQMLGGMAFGVLAAVICYRHILFLERDATRRHDGLLAAAARATEPQFAQK
jgi:putative MATE family efflux protein